jgi:prepilin-type processing-associated H-X9-DG protein/prepilin-type N-terminal cleavage/methylation domain-containing protein
MRLPRRHTPQRGFTLVELLVVVGIVILLLSIALPMLNQARERANRVKCMAQMKQMVTAMLLYCADNRGAFALPPRVGEEYPSVPSLMYYMDPSEDPVFGGQLDYVNGTLWPYISKGVGMRQQVLNCPTDEGPSRAITIGARTTVKERNFTYSWHRGLRAARNPANIASRLNQVKSPTHKIIMYEELTPNDGQAWMEDDDPDDTPSWRHSHMGNYGFADGHVETLSPHDMGYSAVKYLNQYATVVDRKKQRYYCHLVSEY